MRLVAESLACVRGERLVFEHVSFTLSPGQAVVVRGRNGSGKTSLLRVVAGLLSPARGQVHWEHPSLPLAEAVHWVGHADAVKPTLTVVENLDGWRALYGGTPDLVAAALAVFGLDPVRSLPARVLSAGQKRRLALARLLVAPRPLWLLDEPTAGLDGEGERTLDELIAKHLNGGGLALLASHAAALAAREIELGAGTGA